MLCLELFFSVPFSKEIEETVEKLKKQERMLTAKAIELKQKELELREKQKRLEQQFNVVVGYFVKYPNIDA